ncbi:MAG: hypothetical protein H7Y02_02750 [Candidatus Obscuribacterales bacterium]|nr:hypothetical protein [Steroidobacteraceae bacterium]
MTDFSTTSASTNAALEAWLQAQRELLNRWSAAGNGTDAVTDDLQRQMRDWWQSVTQHISPAAQGLAQELAALGPAFFAGTATSLNDLFGINSPGSAALFDAAPIGLFRDHQARWQELARALENQRGLSQQMSGVIAQVHADTLEHLTVRVAELAQTGERITTTRRLYDLWIECGERAFVRVAQQEAFGRLQGELTQAVMQVRSAQQALAEYLLKQLDLPTRAELNTVHRTLRALRARVEQLESERGGAREHG